MYCVDRTASWKCKVYHFKEMSTYRRSYGKSDWVAASSSSRLFLKTQNE